MREFTVFVTTDGMIGAVPTEKLCKLSKEFRSQFVKTAKVMAFTGKGAMINAPLAIDRSARIHHRLTYGF